MARIIETTEDHGLRPHPPARHQAAHQGRRGHRGGGRDRRAARRASTSSPSPERRLGPPAVAAPPAHPDAGVHARTSATRSPARADLGRRDVPRRRRHAHRRDGDAGRRGACWTPAACVEGDKVVIVAGSPPGIPGSTNALRVHRIGDADQPGRARRTSDIDRHAGPDPAGTGTARVAAVRYRAPGCCRRTGRGGGMADTGTQNALLARACGFKSRSHWSTTARSARPLAT